MYLTQVSIVEALLLGIKIVKYKRITIGSAEIGVTFREGYNERDDDRQVGKI